MIHDFATRFVTLWTVALVSGERQQDDLPLVTCQCSVHEKLMFSVYKVGNFKCIILPSLSELRQELCLH